MKKLLFTSLCLLSLYTLWGQTETSSYKSIADKFQNNYNKGNYDSIFNMFSILMQKDLPIEKTKEFLTGLKTECGLIIKREFIKYENGSYASYKTQFEKFLFAVNISVDGENKINGLFIKPFVPDTLPKTERNITKLNLPFKETWNVTWGGDTKELNYHVESNAQKNAFDFLIIGTSGKTYMTDGKTNEDYYAFGQNLYAPCDGEIVLVVDGIKDNIPGEMNSFHTGGNTVIIKTVNNEYLYFCHFKHQSIKVKEGQKIKQGQLLGQCGNSGHSSEPHLHFHIQNIESANNATGIKCYFENLNVNGTLKNDYSPIKGDIIKSTN